MCYRLPLKIKWINSICWFLFFFFLVLNWPEILGQFRLTIQIRALISFILLNLTSLERVTPFFSSKVVQMSLMQISNKWIVIASIKRDIFLLAIQNQKKRKKLTYINAHVRLKSNCCHLIFRWVYFHCAQWMTSNKNYQCEIGWLLLLFIFCLFRRHTKIHFGMLSIA